MDRMPQHLFTPPPPPPPATSSKSSINMQPNSKFNNQPNSKSNLNDYTNNNQQIQSLKQTLLTSSNAQNNSAVTKWLNDLSLMSENECLCVLQAKSLSGKINQIHPQQKVNPIECGINETVISNNFTTSNESQNFKSNDNLYDILELILTLREDLNEELTKLTTYGKFENNNLKFPFKKINNTIQLTIDQVNNLIEYSKSITSNRSILNTANPLLNAKHLQSHLIFIKDIEFKIKICLNNINRAVEGIFKRKNNLESNHANNINNSDINNKLFKLVTSYQDYTESFIRYCVKLQLIQLLSKDSIQTMVRILNQTLEVSLKNEEIKKIIIEENGIIVMFSVLKDPFFKSILDLILRALSILCSHLESFSSLQKIDCFGILTDILCDEAAQEWTRTEAAGCIAQITSPYMEFCENLSGFIENMEDLTRALTILCRDSSDIEIFLIGTAALANITFLDKTASEYLNKFSTAQVLIENYYLKNYSSIFVKDQLTTILANMVLLENCRTEISEFNGLNLLVEFLNEKPSNYISELENNNNQSGCFTNKQDAIESEISACERVQQKAAIAISRFCKESKYASILIELGALGRISFLCHNPAERNNSDSVLVACLAALRQLAAYSDSSALMENDIQKLIKPKLKDSFFMCSSTEESYV